MFEEFSHYSSSSSWSMTVKLAEGKKRRFREESRSVEIVVAPMHTTTSHTKQFYYSVQRRLVRLLP